MLASTNAAARVAALPPALVASASAVSFAVAGVVTIIVVGADAGVGVRCSDWHCHQAGRQERGRRLC